jgi:hypothetical protein
LCSRLLLLLLLVLQLLLVLLLAPAEVVSWSEVLGKVIGGERLLQLLV